MLAACGAAPRAAKPKIEMPVAWALEPPWRESAPRDAQPKGPWWKRFGDPQLEVLQTQALAGSPSLAAAAARLTQARAQAAAASGGSWPQLSLGTRDVRTRITENRPLASYTGTNFSTVQNDLQAAFSVSYELDLAGRVQGAIKVADASAEQSAADLENTRLVLSADVASNYLNLRAIDIELDVLTRSLALQRKALEFVSARRELGATSGVEVAQQQALLDNTLTQLDVLRRQRGPFEHALATLVGTPAPMFAVAPHVEPLALPVVPLGLPSDLLERRPDVASAERAMAVANAQIGLAHAAFYPSITLGSTLGQQSRALASLLDAPSLIWSLGASATQLLFDGGRLKASLAAAQAGHDVAAANYRRVVLTAMQEVEDGITGLAALQRASTQAQVAVGSAQRVLTLATGRYEGGVSSYLDVITAQQALLAAQRQATQLQSQALLVSVFLVKALGGDW